MGVTIELQNLGDAQLCRDITAHLEHAFSRRQGEWRISIAASRVAESWDLRVEGPNGFERSYALSPDAGRTRAAGDPHTCSKARAPCPGMTTLFVGSNATFIIFR
jgi:hypothetical protein